MTKTIELLQHERIAAVVPERCKGPGYQNIVAWVYIVGHGELRTECIQAGEMSEALQVLFSAGAEMAKSLANAVSTQDVKELT